MTYKKIVEHMIQQDSKKWVESLLSESGINFRWTYAGSVTFERDESGNSFYYSCFVDVNAEISPEISRSWYTLEIGGTVDDMIGICHSVIWDGNKKSVWFSREETREVFGVQSFRLEKEKAPAAIGA